MNPEINKACGKLIQKYLMASYAYYILHESVMPDEEYDKLATVLLKYWDQFDHQHKHLISKDDLEAGTLYSLRRHDYPLMVKNATELWLQELRPSGKREIL